MSGGLNVAILRGWSEVGVVSGIHRLWRIRWKGCFYKVLSPEILSDFFFYVFMRFRCFHVTC